MSGTGRRWQRGMLSVIQVTVSASDFGSIGVFTQEGHAIYDPCAPGSRLGMTREAFEKGLAGLGMRRQEDGSYELPEDVEGLHFHTLCEQDADDLECTFYAFEEQFASYLKQVRWLNLGGGHHITRPGYQIERLKKLIGYIRGDLRTCRVSGARRGGCLKCRISGNGSVRYCTQRDGYFDSGCVCGVSYAGRS